MGVRGKRLTQTQQHAIVHLNMYSTISLPDIGTLIIISFWAFFRDQLAD